MARLHLTVSPGARQSAAEVTATGELRVRVAAPATEGKANRELLSFLAKRLGLPRSRVSLIRGESSRHKVVEIEGLPEDEVRRLLIS